MPHPSSVSWPTPAVVADAVLSPRVTRLAIITVLVAQTARRVLAFAAAALLVLEIMVPTGSLPPFRSLFLGWDRR